MIPRWHDKEYCLCKKCMKYRHLKYESWLKDKPVNIDGELVDTDLDLVVVIE